MVAEIIEGLVKAFQLILSGNPTVIEITLRSIFVSGAATLLSVLWSIPMATFLGLRRFRGRFLVKGFFNALLGVPTVALGLILFLLLSRSGPLGFLGILYRPMAIVVGQAVLITPIMVSLVMSTVESVDPQIRDLAKTLGASETEASLAVLRESIGGVGLAVTASFNRAIAELGVALLVGGNIAGSTRVLTTTIALETNRGDLVLGIALAIILLFIVFALSASINLVQKARA